MQRQLKHGSRLESLLVPQIQPISTLHSFSDKRLLGGFRFETVVRQRKIWLLEGGGGVGYCADTKVQDKIDEKMEQHGTLQELLLEYGYHCIYMAFPLGYIQTCL